MVYLDKIRERGKMQYNIYTFLLIIIAIELAFIYLK